MGVPTLTPGMTKTVKASRQRARFKLRGLLGKELKANLPKQGALCFSYVEQGVFALSDPDKVAALLQEKLNKKTASLRKIVETANNASSFTKEIVRAAVPVTVGAVAGTQVRNSAVAANARDVARAHGSERSSVVGTNQEHKLPNSASNAMGHPPEAFPATTLAAPFDSSSAMMPTQICDASPDGSLFNVAALMQSIKDRESLGSGDYLAKNTATLIDEPALGAYQFLPSTAWDQLNGPINLSAFCEGQYASKGWMNPAFQDWFLKHPGAQDFAALRYIHAGVKAGAKTPEQIGAWWLGGSAGLHRPTSIADSNGTTPAAHGKNILASYGAHANEQRFLGAPDLSNRLADSANIHDVGLHDNGTGDHVSGVHGTIGDLVSKLHEHLT